MKQTILEKLALAGKSYGGLGWEWQMLLKLRGKVKSNRL